MNHELLIVFSIIGCTLGLFVWGRIRYDMVAMMALLAGVFSGVVPSSDAFMGFGHPAVVTVAAVLIISKALQNSGVVSWLASLLASTRSSVTLQVSAGSGLVALLSCVMNNVGALALMLPVTLQNAARAAKSPSIFLMPLSFASLLGGLVTLIGTPTNIVISTFRQEFTGRPYQMFDFSYVGAAVALAGLVYLSFVGWRLLPKRRPAESDDAAFHVEEYVSEVLVPNGSSIVGRTVRALEKNCENELTVMAIIRNKKRRLAPHGLEKIRVDDTLILEGDPEILNPFITSRHLQRLEHLVERSDVDSDDVHVTEAVVLPDSLIKGQSMRGVRMHDQYGINLLAISRRGRKPITRLAKIKFQVGDVLLVQGDVNSLEQGFARMGLLEVAERGVRTPQKHNFMLPIGIFAIAIVCAALGVVTVPVAFVSAVVALIAFRVVSAREVYSSVEWPVIILLGALIPVGNSLQATGGTELIATSFVDVFGDMPVMVIIASLMIVSMWLSDIIPNTPVAVLMAPIGFTISQKLGLSADPFLMAVAIGCATPFLTPIGHQSNTLVMGPGGYRFLDYARMGFALELLVVLVAVPMIMLVWLN